MKYEIEIEEPDDYRILRIGIPTPGDIYTDLGNIGVDGKILGNSVLSTADEKTHFDRKKIILSKREGLKIDILLFEQTGEFREPREGEYYRLGHDAVGYKFDDIVIIGKKEILKLTKLTKEED